MGAVSSKQRKKVLASELISNIRLGDDEKVLEMLHNYPRLVFWRDKHITVGAHIHPSCKCGQTALYTAVGVGKVELVRLIIEIAKKEATLKYGASRAAAAVEAVLNATTGRGETALMHACRKGGSMRHDRPARPQSVQRYVEVVKLLLDAGASPLLQDSIGRTCLHIAALSSAASCITTILNAEHRGRAWKDTQVGGGPFVDLIAQRGFTALQMATCVGNRSAAAALLAAGASLHLANGGPLILENDVHLEVPWGQMTPLHVAAHRADADMAWILLHAQTALPVLHQTHGADVRTLRDAQGQRPVDIARQYRNERLLRLLDPEAPLEEVLAELQSAVLPDRERERAAIRGFRRRRLPVKGPPRLSALCAIRLRHSLLNELKHIAIATTPGSTAAVAGRRRHKRGDGGSGESRSARAQRALQARLPDNWREVLASHVGAAGPSGEADALQLPLPHRRAAGPCLLKFKDGQVVVAPGVPPATAAERSAEAQSARERVKAAFWQLVGATESDGSCPVTPLGAVPQSRSRLRRNTTSDAEASPSGLDEAGATPRLLGYRGDIEPSPFETLPSPWDADSIVGPLPDDITLAYDPPSSKATASESASSHPTQSSRTTMSEAPSSVPSQPSISTRPVTSMRSNTSASTVSIGDLLGVLEGGSGPRDPVADHARIAVAEAAKARLRVRRARNETPDDELCPICCEAHPGVAVKACGHALCGTCARKLCKVKASEAPTCPFCRGIIDGFRIAIPIDTNVVA